MNIISVVPAGGASKDIHGKNIISVAGKPHLGW
jgi:CMP-N-acetylneuraminic acid synthetase